MYISSLRDHGIMYSIQCIMCKQVFISTCLYRKGMCIVLYIHTLSIADPPQQGILTEEDHHEGENGERQALLQPPNGPGTLFGCGLKLFTHEL